MTVKETAYTVKRRLVGKQPKPKVPRADHAADDEADFDIDPEGKYECWERYDDNVSTYQGTGPDGPEWLKVCRRLTWDVEANQLIGDELGEVILTDSEIYAPLPEGVKKIRTRLYYERDDVQHEEHAEPGQPESPEAGGYEKVPPPPPPFGSEDGAAGGNASGASGSTGTKQGDDGKINGYLRRLHVRLGHRNNKTLTDVLKRAEQRGVFWNWQQSSSAKPVNVTSGNLWSR